MSISMARVRVRKQPKSTRIMSGIDRTIDGISLHYPTITDSEDGVSLDKTEVKELGSYNWVRLEDGTSAIAVPGHPPKWTPSIPSPKLLSDKEAFQQREAIPRHPYTFEPLSRSISICQSNFDFSSIQVVTQLHNLRKLFRFASGRKKDAFRIDIELVGTTIFMSRFGNDEIIANGTQSADSWGQVFQTYATTYCSSLDEMQASTCHRVIQYNFRGLSIIVQHEVDTIWNSNPNQDSGNDCTGDHKPLAWSQSLLTLRHGSPNHLLDASCIADIKTRRPRSAKFKDKDWVFSQLWFSDTYNILFAQHDGEGVFTKADNIPQNFSDELKRWQQKKKDMICAVGEILKLIVHKVQVHKPKTSNRFALIWRPQEKESCLKLYSLCDEYERHVLP